MSCRAEIVVAVALHRSITAARVLQRDDLGFGHACVVLGLVYVSRNMIHRSCARDVRYAYIDIHTRIPCNGGGGGDENGD